MLVGKIHVVRHGVSEGVEYYLQAKIRGESYFGWPFERYLGASLDGLLSCSCCEKLGVLEVKCPQCVKDEFPVDDDCNFCMTKQSDHTWTLK